MSVETVKKDVGPEETDRVRRWFDEIGLASKEEKKWRDRAAKVVKRYRDEHEAEGSQFNILWSNVETLKPALYSQTPHPDVQRRHKDADPVAKQSCRLIERVLSFSIDDEDFDGVSNQVVADYLLPGRAIARVRYKPTFSQQETLTPLRAEMQLDASGKEVGAKFYDGEDEAPDDKVTIRDGLPFLMGDPVDVLAYEEAPIEYVHWKRFRMSPAETWEEVRWIAFQSYMTRDELTENFGERGGDVPLTLSVVETEEGKETPDEYFKRAEVWEVWDKTERNVCVIAQGYDKYLKEYGDPLRLKTFFPIPKPLYSVSTNGTMVPVPEFCLYQDQADELNAITARIERLVDALKVRGVYDGQFKDALGEMLRSSENEMIAVDGWTTFAEKGGIDGAISWLPIEMIAKTLVHLYQKRSELLDTIYQLTGLSDLQRGSTDPRETARAQSLKGQFASRRLMPRQKEVARFLRDLIRLKAEVISENFSPQTLTLMSGVEVTPEMHALISSDALRSFRIDIETDSTVAADDQAEKEAVMEFLNGTQAFIGTVAPLVQEGAMPVEVAKAILLAVTRRSKFGREVEDAIEMMGTQPKQEKPDPAVVKAQAEAQKMQAEMQFKAKESELKRQEAQAEMQMDVARHAQEMQMMREKAQLEMQLERERAANQLQIDREKAQVQMLVAARVGEAKAQAT